MHAVVTPFPALCELTQSLTDDNERDYDALVRMALLR
jgi:hypothetical protein